MVETWGEAPVGEQELFNYSTSRQQRPRFQEDITACSPEGEAHLACSPIPYPHKLAVGIFNAFSFVGPGKRRLRYHDTCPKCQDQLPGGSKSSNLHLPPPVADNKKTVSCFQFQRVLSLQRQSGRLINRADGNKLPFGLLKGEGEGGSLPD